MMAGVHLTDNDVDDTFHWAAAITDGGSVNA
jgi:hypothetical protein